MPAIAAHEYSPWDFWREASVDERDAQLAIQHALVEGRADHALGEQCFISELASIDNDALRLGDRTYVAAGAYLTGDLNAGADCSINPYTVIRGRVTMGDGVRIGAHTSILGFNHSMESGTPVFRQPLTSKGIEIGDDVWIGSHVVILDGVRVGSHAVLAASAVVTKDVPAGAVVGGNPARFIRWRVEPDDTGVAPDAAADAAARGVDDGAGAGAGVRADADGAAGDAAPVSETGAAFAAAAAMRAIVSQAASRDGRRREGRRPPGLSLEAWSLTRSRLAGSACRTADCRLSLRRGLRLGRCELRPQLARSTTAPAAASDSVRPRLRLRPTGARRPPRRFRRTGVGRRRRRGPCRASR